MTDRVIYLIGKVDKGNSKDVIAAIARLDAADTGVPITLVINSLGGSVVEGMAIVAAMRLARCGVRTVCIGAAGGIAAVVLAAGLHGGRHVVADTAIDLDMGVTAKVGGIVGKKVMEAQMLLKTAMRETDRYTNRKMLDVMYAGKLVNAQEAVELGLADKIVENEVKEHL